jgi:hypothetical protein
MGPLSLDYYADGRRFEVLTNKKDCEFSGELSDYNGSSELARELQHAVALSVLARFYQHH